MRLFALGTATAILAAMPFDVDAADLAAPPSPFVQPEYGLAPGPAVAPPQVIFIPGFGQPPEYAGAPIPPATVGSYPGAAPPVGSEVAIAPGAACAPTWRCWDRACGWQQDCASYRERYGSPYGSGDPQVYVAPDAPSPLDRYSGRYHAPVRQVYPGPGPAPQVYSGPAAPPGLERYGTPYEGHVYPEPNPPAVSERYPDPYGSPSPGIYSRSTAPPAMEQDSDEYGSPRPEVYSRPAPSLAPEPERYPDPDAPQPYPPTGFYSGG
jgi:hypothetical protein